MTNRTEREQLMSLLFEGDTKLIQKHALEVKDIDYHGA